MILFAANLFVIAYKTFGQTNKPINRPINQLTNQLTRAVAASRFPLLQATCRGVLLVLETQSVLAPAAISRSITSFLAPVAAQCSAVSPGNVICD